MMKACCQNNEKYFVKPNNFLIFKILLFSKIPNPIFVRISVILGNTVSWLKLKWLHVKRRKVTFPHNTQLSKGVRCLCLNLMITRKRINSIITLKVHSHWLIDSHCYKLGTSLPWSS